MKRAKPAKRPPATKKPRAAKPAAAAKTQAPIPLHPLCKLLPRMTDAEFAALRQSIIDAGGVVPGKIIDDGITFEGKLLDGRHRQEIAIELGIAFPHRAFDPKRDGPSPYEFVKARATGRHMTESQKAAAAVGFLEVFEGEAAKRKQATQFKPVAGGGTGSTTAALDVACPHCKAKPGKPCFLDGLAGTATQGVHLGRKEAAANAPKLVSGKTRAQMRALIHQNGAKELEYKRDLHAPLTPSDAPRHVIEDAILDRMFGPEEATKAKSRDEAGGLFGVSGRYVQDAKLVKEHDPKLFAEIFEGRTTVTVARAEVRRKLKDKAIQAKAKQPHAAGSVPPWDVSHVPDCMVGLRFLSRRSVRLIFEDGPYNIGVDYGNGAKADQLPADKFVRQAAERFAEEAELLTEDGVLAVMIGDEFAAEYRVALKATPGLYPRAWVKWYETFGNNCRDNFNRCSRHILFFSREKSGPFLLHREAFNRPSARQAVYGDKRANPAGKNADDVWMVPRLNDNAKERVRVDKDGPTQIPLEIVRPIVLGFTDPGDLVVDPFCGTGTTVVACVTTGRRCITFDRIKSTVTLAQTRVKAAIADLHASEGGTK